MRALRVMGVLTLVGCLASVEEGCSVRQLEQLEQLEQAIESFPNQEPAFAYFVNKGLTPVQSAGIVGNLSAESGVDPRIQQIGGGPGRGIAQWQVNGRWDAYANDNVVAYAEERGRDPLSLELQLEFIWYELTSFPSYGLESLRNTTTLAAATNVFASKFEGCSACDTARRIEFAEDVFARFAGDGGASSSSGGPPCTVDETGARGDCVAVDECEARGDSIATPGYCPGPRGIQCCTVVAGGSSSSGSRQEGADGGARGDGGAGTDAAKDVDETDNNDEFRRQPAVLEDPGGGCATSGSTSAGVGWFAAVLAFAAHRRRSRCA